MFFSLFSLPGAVSLFFVVVKGEPISTVEHNTENVLERLLYDIEFLLVIKLYLHYARATSSSRLNDHEVKQNANYYWSELGVVDTVYL